ncbi:hypothetical protein ANCCAN_30383 [Ancylostoma caninum]|uniref:Uncharacterized protein n=1 Tax=Ancylostoma caninum TaxID=29170 RepID=A0A368EXB3_ANCCA|nr:hypothetical protein ANCCAN_30383 [Ancylostoma caninum]
MVLREGQRAMYLCFAGPGKIGLDRSGVCYKHIQFQARHMFIQIHAKTRSRVDGTGSDIGS